jgi:hypothetical protein
MKTLVPRVLNPSVLQADRRAAATGSGELWTADRFYSDLAKRCGNEAVSVFRKIEEWSHSLPELAIFYGRGKSDGSLQIAYKGGDDPSIYQYQSGDTVILTLWSYGRVEIEFQYLMARQAFASQAVREELLRQLTLRSTLKISAEKISKRPSVQWSELADAANMRTLFSAMEWVVKEFAATKSGSGLLTGSDANGIEVDN